MDALCRALAGADPDDYPCGWESCRGRVPEGVPLAGRGVPDGAPAVVAVGGPDDPAAHFDALSFADGAEVLDPEAEEWLGSARRTPGP